MIDRSDDRKKLQASNYDGDDLLRLCDPQRQTRHSHHLLCELLLDHEIADLVDGMP